MRAQAPEEAEASSGEWLRGVFLEQGAPDDADRVVGRLAIRLLEDDDSVRVPPSRPFRSGERFRFEVTSNHDGWVWIFHRSPDSTKSELLWPPASYRSMASTDEDMPNYIRKHQTVLLPPSPGKFRFDAQTGEEYFYVEIASEDSQGENDDPPVSRDQNPDPPATNPSSRSQSGDTAASRKLKIVNFRVRGDPSERAKRGVVFDPGAESEAPYLYFTASNSDDKSVATVEFQLRHAE